MYTVHSKNWSKEEGVKEGAGDGIVYVVISDAFGKAQSKSWVGGSHPGTENVLSSKRREQSHRMRLLLIWTRSAHKIQFLFDPGEPLFKVTGKPELYKPNRVLTQYQTRISNTGTQRSQRAIPTKLVDMQK